MAIDSDDNLYVANFVGFSVSKFTPGTSTPSDALTGENRPNALAFDGSGNLYVTSQGSNSVSIFAPGATTPSSTLTGLFDPRPLAFDTDGNLYVGNRGNGTVSKFAPGATSSTDTLIGLSSPDALAFDTGGDLYVANRGNGTVSIFAPGATSPSATLTGLNYPVALAFDGSGNLYVANQAGNTVSKFVPGATTPSATLTGLNSPTGLAIDAGGNLYVANQGGNTVSKFVPGATTPSVTLTGLSQPVALVFDRTGDLYVANSVNDTVTMFANPAKAVKTLSVSAYTINDGNGGNNYLVTTVNSINGVINPATLTITPTPNTKTYDSTTSAAAMPTVSGLLSGDTVTGLSEAYASANAGTGKILSVTGYTINDGNGGGNYRVTLQTNTTASINKAPLTIVAVTNTKFYDGTTSAVAMPTVSGLRGNDKISDLAEVYSDPKIGTGKILSVSAYTVSDGYAGNNYAVTTVNNMTGTIAAPVTDVSIFNTQGSELEPPEGGKANYVFTIHLASALPQAVTATYSTFNSTGANGAKAGTDFKGITNGTVNIPAGATDVPFNITILGDAPEAPNGPADKYFSVQLSRVSNALNYTQNLLVPSATGDIKQTFVPIVSIAPTQTAFLTSSGIYAVTVNVTSTYPSLAYAQAAGIVSVSYYTTNGTAKSGVNFKGASGNLIIPAAALVSGSSTVTIPITGIGPANGQTFNVTMSMVSSNAVFGSNMSSTVTIYNPQLLMDNIGLGTLANSAFFGG